MTDPENSDGFSNCGVAADVRSELAREMSAQEIAAAQGEARLFRTRQ
jgi:hypothetical protein